MKKIKIIYAILAVILFAMTAFVACSESVHPFATNSADCSAVDSAAATMAENSVLEGLSANVDTAGAVAVSDGDVTITESGSYIFRHCIFSLRTRKLFAATALQSTVWTSKRQT